MNQQIATSQSSRNVSNGTRRAFASLSCSLTAAAGLAGVALVCFAAMANHGVEIAAPATPLAVAARAEVLATATAEVSMAAPPEDGDAQTVVASIGSYGEQ